MTNKKLTRKFTCLLLIFLLLNTLTSCSSPITQNKKTSTTSAQATTSEDTAFIKYLDTEFTDTLKDNDTITLHYLLAHPEKYGITKPKITLGDLSVADLKKSEEKNVETYKKLKKFDRNKLSKNNQITYDSLKFTLETEQMATGYEWYGEVLSPTLGVPAQLPVTLNEFSLTSKNDVETYFTLLSKVPDYFNQIAVFEQGKAKQGLFMSDAVAKESIKQMKEFTKEPDNCFLIQTFQDRIKAINGLSKKEQDDYIQKNTSYIKKYIIPAYETLAKEITALLGQGKNSNGLCNLPDGKDYYKYLLRNNICSTLSPSSCYRKLELRLSSLIREVSSLVKENPDIYTEYDQIKYNMNEPDKVLQYLKKEISTNYPAGPDVSYTVKHVHPSLAESLSPAFYMVPQIDNYKNNVIYINDKSSNYNEKSLFSTLAHEGYPGHMYQITYFNSTNPHPIRQVLNFGGYSEGYATYVEMNSYEMYNFGKSDKALSKLCQVDSELSLVLSSIADIGINYKGWTKADLKSYFKKYNLDDDSMVNAVFDAVVEDPTNYLQYYMGYLQFVDLETYAKNKLGQKYNAKAFHKVLLDCGPTTFDVLKDQVKQYVNEN